VSPETGRSATRQRTVRSTVSTARCADYDLAAVRRAVRACVEALPGLQERFDAAGNVLVKPNLLSAYSEPERHVNTHPAVVRAVAELLIGDFGCAISIGDSCGSLGRSTTAEAIRKAQIDRIAEELGAGVYNVDRQPRHVVRPEGAEVFREIPLPTTLDEFDLVVSVAKLKTHQLTTVTGPVKNIFGLVPGAGKKRAHSLAPRVHEFARLICDLYAHVAPGAAFVDGIVGMDGRGPAHGGLREVQLIGASADPVALDSFCAQVMGFDPLQIPLLAECARRGLGAVPPRDIEVIGEPAEAFALPDFAKPTSQTGALILRLVPRWLFGSAFSALVTKRAHIDQKVCIRCGECERNCPSQAISRVSGQFRVDRRKCISCFCCGEVCPADAISLRGTWVRRAVNLARAPFR
jgi:uncharacterized protein (DUF362 family)/Pyruvate/2-oxoacid:ferredoxin oxidoreductase delta subunit